MSWAPITHGALTAMASRFTGSQHIAYTASAGTPVSTGSAFAVNQHLLSCREAAITAERGLYNNSLWSEDAVWHGDPGAAATAAIMSEQRSYWGAS